MIKGIKDLTIKEGRIWLEKDNQFKVYRLNGPIDEFDQFDVEKYNYKLKLVGMQCIAGMALVKGNREMCQQLLLSHINEDLDNEYNFVE